MTTQTEITQRNHHRAVRFFWCFLIGATLVSLIGNITHAVLPYIPHVVIQIGAAAVPPIALLAAVHGIALAVRAGASGRVYCWAVSAVAAIGVGAFAVSFLALRDLMRVIGYSSANWMDVPRDHRYHSGRQHHDAGCARGQTSAPRPPCDHISAYKNPNHAAVGATSDSECKNRDQTIFTDQCAETNGTSQAGTDFCIGTTRPANRGDPGRCRPCIRTDYVRRNYTAHWDRDCGVGSDSSRRVGQRCRQSIRD